MRQADQQPGQEASTSYSLSTSSESSWQVGKYVFLANYDSANLARACIGTKTQGIQLWIRKDCEGTASETTNRTWFYFGLEGGVKGEEITMTLMNMNNMKKLYLQGFRPFFKPQSSACWEPVKGKLNTVTVDGDFRVRFCYTFTSGEPVAFAFCYPFSYSDQQQLLDSLDTLYKSSASPNRGSSPSSSSSIHQGHLSSIPSPSSALKDSTPINSDRLAEPGEEPCLGGSTGRQSHSQTPGKMGGRGLGLAGVASSRSPLERLNTQQAPRRSASRDLPASCGLVPSLEATALGSEEVSAGPALFDDRDWDPVEPSQIFYSRQLLALSLEGRRVDLVTITDPCRGENQAEVSSSPSTSLNREQDTGAAGLFSGGADLFPSRKMFFISARVHPGETPSSHMMNGMISFLLSQDPRAAALRRSFVFLLVPMLNPDGVALGHTRADTLGQNLNRFYAAPSPETQPAIYAVKKLLLQYSRAGRLAFYLDLHAHANKRGVFAYGNTVSGDQALEGLLYAKLASLNSPHFDFAACNFSEANMCSKDKQGASKEGSGRVAIFRETGLLHIYTVEANFHSCRFLNAVANTVGEEPLQPVVRPAVNTRFTVQVLHDVGRALLVAALDLAGTNPCSRLPNTRFQDREGVQKWLQDNLKETACVGTGIPSLSELSLEKTTSGMGDKRWNI